jgi:hypothetical protein
MLSELEVPNEYDRDAGIKAIIELQKVAGVIESEEKAAKGWDAMTPEQKSSTVWMHGLLFPKEKGKFGHNQYVAVVHRYQEDGNK